MIKIKEKNKNKEACIFKDKITRIDKHNCKIVIYTIDGAELSMYTTTADAANEFYDSLINLQHVNNICMEVHELNLDLY